MRRLLALILCALLCASLALPALAEEEAAPQPTKKKDGAIAIELNMRLEDGSLVPVELKTIGSVYSLVTYNGEDIWAETARLTWDTNAPEAHRAGYLYAPKNGKVTMRLSEKPKSSIVKKIPSGCTCLIFDEAGTYTGIICDGKSGYVLTSAIRFVPRNVQTTPAVLSYKGRTDRTTKLNLRIAAKQSARILVGLRPGMPARVFRENGSFLELEANGYHGWLRKTFVTLEEPLPTGTPVPSPTPAPAGNGDPS